MCIYVCMYIYIYIYIFIHTYLLVCWTAGLRDSPRTVAKDDGTTGLREGRAVVVPSFSFRVLPPIRYSGENPGRKSGEILVNSEEIPV